MVLRKQSNITASFAEYLKFSEKMTFAEVFWVKRAGCTTHFFRLHQQNKSSESKVNFRQASNRCKKILEDAKLAYANKRAYHFPET